MEKRTEKSYENQPTKPKIGRKVKNSLYGKSSQSFCFDTYTHKTTFRLLQHWKHTDSCHTHKHNTKQITAKLMRQSFIFCCRTPAQTLSRLFFYVNRSKKESRDEMRNPTTQNTHRERRCKIKAWSFFGSSSMAVGKSGYRRQKAEVLISH